LPSFCVELAILVSLRDLISLTSNWHSCGSGRVVLSQSKREVQTLLIAPKLSHRWSVQACGRAEHWWRRLLKCACGFSVTEKDEKPPEKTAIAIERRRGQAAELNRPAPLYDVRFRTISLDPASEKLAGNQPSIRKKTEKWVARPSHLIAPPASRLRKCSCSKRHPRCSEP
jgi:hypothetical protein